MNQSGEAHIRKGISIKNENESDRDRYIHKSTIANRPSIINVSLPLFPPSLFFLFTTGTAQLDTGRCVSYSESDQMGGYI